MWGDKYRDAPQMKMAAAGEKSALENLHRCSPSIMMSA
jgi:hypothetical protein